MRYCKTCGGIKQSTGGPGESFICYECDFKPSLKRLKKENKSGTMSTAVIAETLFSEAVETYEGMKHI